ncbi:MULTISPECIES: hypothetical protein [Agrobacterium]|uniref:hypothetical protein n=1 Tax=Agrobacterium TaxID=357 RepID=UPI00097CF128|nr:hypothetical protein [Agrobacterium sp. DSM 25558]
MSIFKTRTVSDGATLQTPMKLPQALCVVFTSFKRCKEYTLMEIGILITLFFTVFAASSVFCAYWFGEKQNF